MSATFLAQYSDLVLLLVPTLLFAIPFYDSNASLIGLEAALEGLTAVMDLKAARAWIEGDSQITNAK